MLKNTVASIFLLISLHSFTVTAQTKVAVIPLGETPKEPVSKLIFVTQGTWKGSLGGVEGADAKCAQEARTRGIPGRFDSLLGTFYSSTARSNHYALFYVRLSDGEDIASNYHSLFSEFSNHQLDNKVIDTNDDVPVWTGLEIDGSSPSNMNNCTEWTSKQGTGRVGRANRSDVRWVSDADFSCNQFRHLYCIEQ